MHHGGTIARESRGYVRYAMENLGRRLMRIDLDSGRSVVLLADDVAIEGDARGSSA
jgi:hypothetical protein